VGDKVVRIVKQAQMLAGLALLGIAGFAFADAPRADAASTETVVVIGTTEGCNEATPERARSLADKASQDRAFQRAGECYLAAGEHALANQAFVKASAQASGDTSRRLASNLGDVKAQAKQMKQAFQRR
jgi:hypothetical protein